MASGLLSGLGDGLSPASTGRHTAHLMRGTKPAGNLLSALAKRNAHIGRHVAPRLILALLRMVLLGARDFGDISMTKERGLGVALGALAAAQKFFATQGTKDVKARWSAIVAQLLSAGLALDQKAYVKPSASSSWSSEPSAMSMVRAKEATDDGVQSHLVRAINDSFVISRNGLHPSGRTPAQEMKNLHARIDAAIADANFSDNVERKTQNFYRLLYEWKEIARSMIVPDFLQARMSQADNVGGEKGVEAVHKKLDALAQKLISLGGDNAAIDSALRTTKDRAIQELLSSYATDGPGQFKQENTHNRPLAPAGQLTNGLGGSLSSGAFGSDGASGSGLHTDSRAFYIHEERGIRSRYEEERAVARQKHEQSRIDAEMVDRLVNQLDEAQSDSALRTLAILSAQHTFRVTNLEQDLREIDFAEQLDLDQLKVLEEIRGLPLQDARRKVLREEWDREAKMRKENFAAKYAYVLQDEIRRMDSDIRRFWRSEAAGGVGLRSDAEVTHYGLKVFGLDQISITEETLKKKYRDLARKYHPDKSSDDHATEKFQVINSFLTWFFQEEKIITEQIELYKQNGDAFVLNDDAISILKSMCESELART